MKAVVATFNQENALVGALFVIVQLHLLIVYSTNVDPATAAAAPQIKYKHDLKLVNFLFT